ncbi:MAG TPA: alpha-D-ribose 1-methylphosphonate 5-triphosphate diphosphatase [Nordella sp.]|nr:alpha-D-ribose 1-methylphosphonate 5-triphosphate diphosphatase [Nordella sp.]
MTKEKIFSNAKIVTADAIIEGTVLLRDGMIADISTGAMARSDVDLDGAYLLPGLVELHTDHLESHYRPRPGVHWPAIGALLAHDAQIAAAGITTVFDALRAGTFDSEAGGLRRANDQLSTAIADARAANMLRADHRVHLRCELPCPDTFDTVEELVAQDLVELLSVMDHTPGERQFVSIEKFREYYLGKGIMGPERLEVFIAERREMNQLHSERNRRAIVNLAVARRLKLASHDDATEEHVAEAIADGVSIAEFPTTEKAAQAAHASGLAVLMGAPNLVRGGSHSGNIPTADVAKAGCLDLMSSDYVPASLLHAAFALPENVPGIRLSQAVNVVSRNPARVMGLSDRGEIAPGKRADLIEVRLIDRHPVVRTVWRAGERVL